MSIMYGLVGCIEHPQINYEQVNYCHKAWANQPTQMISYVSCYDDLCLADRVRMTLPKWATCQEAIKLQKLALTIVLTSQGIPFLFAGDELMRNKKGVCNSYNSPDEINAIDWSLKAENLDLFKYYQGLIAMRKAHPAFHMGNADLVRAHVHFLPVEEGVVAYTLNGEAVGDDWKNIVVVLNGQTKATKVALPEGEWYVACADGKCLVEDDKTIKDIASVAAQTAMVLYTK